MDTIEGRSESVLLIDAPPRHGKSQLCSRFLPTWYLGTHPDKHVLLACHGADFAESWGRRARALMREFGPSIFGVQLDEDKTSAGDWEIAYHGGGMKTAGIGGDLMGRGANVFIIDDYIKNPEDAQSETIRNKQWEWYNGGALTRLEPGGVVIIIAQRWHKKDLGGMVLKSATEDGLPVRHIRLPAIAEEGDDLGREIGAPLWPERWPLLDKRNEDGTKTIGLISRQNQMPVYLWCAQYQQRPTRHDQTEWPDEYFDNIYAERWPDTWELHVTAVDPSKGRDTGDPSCIVGVGCSGNDLWVDARIERIPTDDIVAVSTEMCLQNSSERVGVEENAFQFLLADIYERYCAEIGVVMVPVELMNNTVNKNIRISRLGPLLKRGKIHVRDNAGGRRLVQQMQEFPIGDHDDGPDALEMAIRLIRTIIQRVHEEQDENRFNVVTT